MSATAANVSEYVYGDSDGINLIYEDGVIRWDTDILRGDLNFSIYFSNNLMHWTHLMDADAADSPLDLGVLLRELNDDDQPLFINLKVSQK